MCVSLILSFIPLKTGSPISKLVLLKLADNADARGVCFPSFNYLAQYCEVSVRTVKRPTLKTEAQMQVVLAGCSACSLSLVRCAPFAYAG